MSEHPIPEELEKFATGNLPSGLFWRTARHLLQGCLACRALLMPVYEGLFASNSEPLVLDTTVRAHRRYLRREEIHQRKAAALLEGSGGCEALINSSEIAFRGLGVLKALLDRSWSVRFEHPQKMVGISRLAVEVARKLDRRYHDDYDSADWQARAWGELANAHRVSDDLDQAERAFGIAFDFLLHGTSKASLKARLHDLHASYLGTRRQFSLAFAALDIVHSTYLELGDLHLAGKALATKAMYLHYNCQSEEALVVNQQAMLQIDKDRDANILFYAIHNHIRFLLACGRFRDARVELFKNLSNLNGLDGRTCNLKLRWLQAQISAGLHEWRSAEEGLLEVRAGFEEEGMGFHAALASLELALAWMQQGRCEDAREIVLDVCEVFIALRIQREAFGAVMVLKGTFERRAGTIRLLRDAVKFLDHWHPGSNERFTPRGE